MKGKPAQNSVRPRSSHECKSKRITISDSKNGSLDLGDGLKTVERPFPHVTGLVRQQRNDHRQQLWQRGRPPGLHLVREQPPRALGGGNHLDRDLSRGRKRRSRLELGGRSAYEIRS